VSPAPRASGLAPADCEVAARHELWPPGRRNHLRYCRECHGSHRIRW
jgi:hypothetical protein